MHSALLVAGLLLLSDDVQRVGKPLEGLPAVSIDDVLKSPEPGKKVRLEGTIDRVCQAKGCWLALKQGARALHVTFEGYSFFVPKDSAGKKVALEGKILVRDPDPAEVEHLKKEGAGDAAAVVTVP